MLIRGHGGNIIKAGEIAREVAPKATMDELIAEIVTYANQGKYGGNSTHIIETLAKELQKRIKEGKTSKTVKITMLDVGNLLTSRSLSLHITGFPGGQVELQLVDKDWHRAINDYVFSENDKEATLGMVKIHVENLEKHIAEQKEVE